MKFRFLLIVLVLSGLLSACFATGETEVDVQSQAVMAAPIASTVTPQPTQEIVVGYFTSECDGLVEDAVSAAYETSLVASGMGSDEAAESRSRWNVLIPGLEIVVVSQDRGTEIFRGSRAFEAIAINDPGRYPSGCQVAVAADCQYGSAGYRLIDFVGSSPYKLISIYQWGIIGDSYGVELVDPEDDAQAANVLFRP